SFPPTADDGILLPENIKIPHFSTARRLPRGKPKTLTRLTSFMISRDRPPVKYAQIRAVVTKRILCPLGRLPFRGGISMAKNLLIEKILHCIAGGKVIEWCEVTL